MIRIGMALAVAALTGCTSASTPGISTAAADTDATDIAATCDHAAYSRRNVQRGDALSDVMQRIINYKGDISEWVDDKLKYKKDYCLLTKESIKAKSKIIQFQKGFRRCMNPYFKLTLDNDIKSLQRDTENYQRKCSHHNI